MKVNVRLDDVEEALVREAFFEKAVDMYVEEMLLVAICLLEGRFDALIERNYRPFIAEVDRIAV
jgi:hypothetical protein